jgi:hypothetical protein
MIISDLNKMEEIVDKNSNLSWEGWNVVQLIQDDYAEYLINGVFDKKKLLWYRKNVFPCTEKGWDIPESVT